MLKDSVGFTMMYKFSNWSGKVVHMDNVARQEKMAQFLKNMSPVKEWLEPAQISKIMGKEFASHATGSGVI